MSAYLCSPDHIGQLASAMSCHIPVGNKNIFWKEMAKLLANANWVSIEEKYGETEAKWMNDGYGVEVFEAKCVEKALITDTSLKPIDLIKMAKAFSYQACESSYWDAANYESDYVGKWHIDYFIHNMITQLPGWDDAPWEYEAKADAPVVSNLVKLVG